MRKLECMKYEKRFFKDSKIKFPAYEPWISNDDKKIVNKALKSKYVNPWTTIRKI